MLNIYLLNLVLPNNINYVVCSVYFPPNCPLSAYESFISAVQSVLLLHPECVFIFCGDFNLPDIMWSNDDFGLLYNTVSNPRVQCIPDAFAFFIFFQLNDIQNSFGVVLDLVFSNDNSIYISKAVTSAVPCDPYHPVLDILIKLDKLSPLLDRSHNYYDFRRAPYSKICEFLNSFNWLEIILSLDVDEAAKVIYDTLHFCILNFVPKVSYTLEIPEMVFKKS
uniref:Endonuclease/exonuclease/phosphatase domain-containing protein n=1 Tax=Sipha flava TaxID=143950 RepID=A0A2S2QRB9_9HEMI